MTSGPGCTDRIFFFFGETSTLDHFEGDRKKRKKLLPYEDITDDTKKRLSQGERGMYRPS